MNKKSYRFYKEDHRWLKQRALDTDRSMQSIIKEMFSVQEKLSHYFEETKGHLKDRKSTEGTELERALLEADDQVYGINEDMAKWLDDFLYDERTYFENTLSTSMILHLLIDQYRFYLKNKVEILSWYKTYMPHALES